MDADKISFPKEFLQEAGRRNLLGLRFPVKWGGCGLTWNEELIAMEDVSTLGICFSCQYSLVFIVGETVNVYGTDVQKEKYLKPTLTGTMYCAEALTELRGWSDFFGATTTARREGDYYILNGQKRFVVGAEGADYFAVYVKTNPEAKPHESFSLLIADRDEGVNFKIADCLTKLDAVTAFAHTVAKIVQEELGSASYRRRQVSEVKKFSTQAQWEVLNDCMQILGGIGYTNALPVERELRGARLSTIWTGTTEVQNMIIQHEYSRNCCPKGSRAGTSRPMCRSPRKSWLRK